MPAPHTNKQSVYATLFPKALALEHAFVKAGGTLIAGTDPTGGGGVVPGYSNQRQLELLVEAGFTPLEAISIGTINGARFLGREGKIGSIAAGKQADLVVVSGDPSSSIGDVRNVEIVFKQGVGFDPAKLIDSVREKPGCGRRDRGARSPAEAVHRRIEARHPAARDGLRCCGSVVVAGPRRRGRRKALVEPRVGAVRGLAGALCRRRLVNPTARDLQSAGRRTEGSGRRVEAILRRQRPLDWHRIGERDRRRGNHPTFDSESDHRSIPARRLRLQQLATLKSDELIAGTPFPTVVLPHRMIIPFGRRLVGEDGAFEGAVVATAIPEDSRRFFKTVDVGSSGQLWVFHPTGVVLFREPSADNPIGESALENPISESRTVSEPPEPCGDHSRRAGRHSSVRSSRSPRRHSSSPCP